MFPRPLAPQRKRLSEQYPVVSVTGPRQSGKTTLTRMVFPDFRYVTLEDIEERDFATKDPKGFLARFGGGIILDEGQRAPDLFSSIQTRVDAARHPGQFILTGSQQFLMLSKVGQTLAGRTALLRLLPLSLSELRGSRPVDPGRTPVLKHQPPPAVSLAQ